MKHISGDRGEEENADYSVCVLVQKCCRYVVAFLRNMRLKAHGVPAVFNFGSLTTVSLAVRYRYAFLIGWGRTHVVTHACRKGTVSGMIRGHPPMPQNGYYGNITDVCASCSRNRRKDGKSTRLNHS